MRTTRSLTPGSVLTWLLLSVALMTGGCATVPMAYNEGDATAVEASKAVALMSITVKNPFAPRFQPKLRLARVAPVKTDGADDKAKLFSFDESGAEITDSHEAGNSYLVRMELDPGQYTLRFVNAQAMGFPVIGNFELPMHLDMALGEPGIFYLGHVAAVIRERKEGEFRAGPVIPLIDQAVVGASNGTVDVEVSDRQTVDEAHFKSTFPALKDAQFTKAIMPPFDRARAQKYWE